MPEIGVFSFGDTYPNPVTGERQTAYDNLKDLLERIELADRLGLDFFGVGEHHRPDFSVAACSTVLAAAAARTKTIRLGTATIVLSTDDPVRLYQQFATLDLLSHGRAELGLGGGVFLESFDLFGVDYADRNAYFDEKLNLIANIDAHENVTFKGVSRPALDNLLVWPRPLSGHLDLWQTTGLSEESFLRAAKLGFSVQTGSRGPDFERLAELVTLYRQAASELGHPANRSRVALSAHGYIGDDNQKAIDSFFIHYQTYVANMRLNRGKPVPTREQYEEAVEDLNSNIIVGDAKHVLAKLKHQYARIGHDRHIFQLDWRAVPHTDQLRAIEILGSDIAPEFKKLDAASSSQAA